MSKLRLIKLLCISWTLVGCSPVETPTTNQYKLALYSKNHLSNKHSSRSILVSQPEAVGGYQTEQMLYIKKPFELNSFLHSAWADPPANMLFPLIVQSLQYTGYFYAVASSPYSEQTDYRIDTQLITLQQDFLCKPSAVELVVKVVLTHVSDNRIVASRVMSQRVSCPQQTPYGGVVAANQATLALTGEITQFVLAHMQ